ncbi:MAG: O-antigen ligase family protein [Burkholderiales bacterium]
MILNLKALVVVLTLASIVFAFAKPVCLRFTAADDFARRRMVWYVLTVVAFVSPSFWLYVLVAAPLLGWASMKDASPVSLFLFFFFVIPPLAIDIPVVAINKLFPMSNIRLLCFVVLLPAVLSRVRMADDAKPFRLSAMDWLLLMYGALQLVLFMPYESYTNTARRGMLYLLDVFLVFFACSRLLSDKRRLADALSAFWLSGSIMALVAAFESLRYWLLYVDIPSIWGDPNDLAFLLRGDALRAQASTGHALALGYVLCMALGCWMYLQSSGVGKARNVIAIGLLAAGLVFCYSRGPWLTAVLVVMVFIALGSGNSAKLIKGALLLAVVVGAFAATPFGESLMDSLPFIGTRDQETVEYRRQLFETSWALILQHPFIGNPFVALDMESLRQGQGIIDLVNGYLQVALYYGLIGLALYSSVHLLTLKRAFSFVRIARSQGHGDTVALGGALMACVASNLFFMATAGQSWLQWAFVGLLAAFSRLASTQADAAQGRNFPVTSKTGSSRVAIV